jgi:hypothetical protein
LSHGRRGGAGQQPMFANIGADLHAGDLSGAIS